MTAPVNPGAPVLAEDVNDLGDGSTRRPVARLVAAGTQSLPNNTATAIAFAGEDYDSHGGHDTVTNNSRWTVPAGWDGYYDLRGAVTHGARTDYSFVDAWVRKSGTVNIPSSGRRPGGNQSQVNTVPVFARVFLSAGEYVELVAQQNNTAAVAQLTNQSGQFTSTFEITFDRY